MKRQGGMGLIEVVVGLGLMVLAILGLNSLAISLIRGNLSARLTDEATRLAQSKIEEVRSAGYTAARVGTTTEAVLSAIGTPGLTFGRTTTIAAGPLPGTRTVTITMSWYDEGLRQATFLSEIVQ